MSALRSPVPVPLGPAPVEGMYARAKGREELIARSFLSDLEDAAASPSLYHSQDFCAQALRHLFGNANIFESELDALLPTFMRLFTSGDVRQFVREIAKSASFSSRFFDSLSPSRFVEVCFKNLLGRAPGSHSEIVDSLAVLQGKGYDAFIDSIVDSQEYADRFGACLLPTATLSSTYVGGMKGFNTLMRLQLSTRGAATDVTCTVAQATSVLAGNTPAGIPEIISSYRQSVPQYNPHGDWNELPTSSLLTDWSRFSLVLSGASRNLESNGLTREGGEADGPWEAGWEPAQVGSTWKAGWFHSSPKSYV